MMQSLYGVRMAVHRTPSTLFQIIVSQPGIACVVSWFIGWVYVVATLVRFLVIPVNGFQVSFLKMEFVTENSVRDWKILKTVKYKILTFQNFEKIDLIILANRFNWSNRKKSLNRSDRFIGQRINKLQGCRKQTPSARKSFFRANLLYVPDIKM